MPFEVCYTGDSTTWNLFASTPETKGDRFLKYQPEAYAFYKKMDDLSKDYAQLKESSESFREKLADIAKEAGNKAIAEKYPDGVYEIDFLDIADNSLEEKLEAKAEEMLELCREFFTHEVKVEGGVFDFEEQNTSGEISVDGEDLDMGDEWEDVFENQEDENSEEVEKLHSQDWCVSYYVQYKSSWSATIEEGEFDKKKLNWKNLMVHYGDNPINEDVAGARPIAEEIYLVVDGQTYDL